MSEKILAGCGAKSSRRSIERREEREAARLQALREAARVCFADLDEGRFDDVPYHKLEGYIGNLGREAAARVLRETGF